MSTTIHVPVEAIRSDKTDVRIVLQRVVRHPRLQLPPLRALPRFRVLRLVGLFVLSAAAGLALAMIAAEVGAAGIAAGG